MRKPLFLLFSLFLVTLLTLTMTACSPGGGGDEGEPGDETPVSGETPIGETPTEAPGETPTETPQTARDYVRPNIGKLDPNGPEIAALRKGVEVMKSRPASDPTSWLYQANMHGTYDEPALEAWNSCQHGSFFFLSWHRMYLYYFERILRKASGDDNFALPFWDYTDPAQRAIPAPFRNPANAQNPLFVAERNPPINQGAQIPESATRFTQAMAFTNFTSPAGSALSFGGQLVNQPTHFSSTFGQIESQPHNIIHVLVGGNTGWMSDPNLAARDPIFWLHHANIDRLWSVWIAQGDRQDPSEANWRDQVFVFFDENGQRVEMTGKQVVDTAQQLHYTYAEGSGDTPGLQGAREALPTATFTDNRRDVLFDKKVSARLTRQRTQVAVQVPPAQMQGLEDENRRLALIIDGIRFGRPGRYYEVYANLPANAQPNPSGPHYVGNLAIFGQLEDGSSAHAGHGGANKALREQAAVGFEITELIERLRGQQGFQGDVTLTFVPRGLESGQAPAGADREVRFERVRIVLE